MEQVIVGGKEASALSEAEKMLETFLEKNAISKEQFEKSLGDLTEKMGYGNRTEAEV